MVHRAIVVPGRSSSAIASIHGTLPQLLQATTYRSYLRSNCSAPNHIHECDPPPADAQFSLIDVLSRTPELRETFWRWRQDRQMVQFWPEVGHADGTRELRIHAPYNHDDAVAVSGAWERIDRQGVLMIKAPAGASIAYMSDGDAAFGTGDPVATNPFPGGLTLSKIGMAFVLAYAMGMLVRYYPSHWVGMLYNRRLDAGLPTLLAALGHVEEIFPRLVVEFLGRPRSLRAG